MRKKNLFIISLCYIVALHAENLSQYNEIATDKSIGPREIVENAVEEAIMCLQQLQGRLMEAVVHRWAEILKEYFENLLNNQVNMHTYTKDEGALAKNYLNDIAQLKKNIIELENRIKNLEQNLM